MADQPKHPKDEEKVETHSGQIGDAQKPSPARAAAAHTAAVSADLLDERQRRIGERRKPAGPAHTEALGARSVEQEEPSDVPPTDCDDSQTE